MRHLTTHALQAFTGLLCLAGAASAQGLMATSGTIVAANGDATPDLNGLPIPGFTFGGSGALGDNPVMDESGNVYFRGRFQDTGSSLTTWNDRAFFYGSSRSNLRMIIRGGDQAPGVPAGILLRTTTGSATSLGGSPRLSPDGRMWWGSNLYDGGVTVTSANDSAIFGGFVGAQTVMIRKGDVAPGTGGALFAQAFNSPSQQNTGINRQGRIYFQGTLVTGTGVPAVTTTSGINNQAGIWAGLPGALELVARKSDPVSGLSGAVAIDTASTIGFLTQMNDSGQFLYEVQLSTTQGVPAATATNDRAYLVHTPGMGSAKVVREGDPAPGTFGGPGPNFATFNAITGDNWFAGVSGNNFTNAGDTLFRSELRGGDVVAGVNDSALFLGGTAGLTMVSRRGQPAPGTDANFRVWNDASLGLNANGQICFQGTLEGGTSTTANDSGIWVGVPGSLALAIREGDLVPGTGGSTAGSVAGQAIQFNGAGQVLFNLPLVGGTITGSSLFSWDSVNGLTAIVLPNELIQITTGVFKNVQSFGGVQFNNTSGAGLSFGHDGRFALRIGFTDGTAAIMIARLPSSTPTTNFCFGDGSGTACPCGPGTGGNGCPNSLNANGALLSGSGLASLTGDSFLLTGSGMPESSALYFQGTTKTGAGAGVVFGDGLRCVAGVVVRLGDTTNINGTSQYPSAIELPVHEKGAITAPGVRYYQCWYRNANPTFCTPSTFNLTNGTEVTWIN